MEKPSWMCGTAERWSRMEKGMSILSIAGKMRSHVGLSVLGELGFGGGLGIGSYALLAGALGVGAPAAAVIGSCVGVVGVFMTVTSLLETAGGGNTLSSNIVEALGRRRLRKDLKIETISSLEELDNVAVSALKASSTPLMKTLADGLTAVAKKVIEEKMEESRNVEEEERVATAVRVDNPNAFKANDEWKPTDMEQRLGILGSVAADGVAAASMAVALLKEKDLDEGAKSELLRVTGDLLPRLVEAFEKIPKEEREKTLPELDKSPKEAFEEGLSAALARVLKVRATLTARAKVEVEAEKNVLKSGI